MRACLLALALLAGALGCGHAKEPQAFGPCEMARPQLGGSPRPLRALDWLHLLVVADMREGGLYAQTLCTGERIEPAPLPADCEVRSLDPGVPEPVPLTEASVVESMLPDNQRLVWIVTHHFPNGDGFGPVASIVLSQDAVYVGAVGMLRLRPSRVDLKLWQVGNGYVLMAAGESCEDTRKAATCRRASNLMVFDNRRYHSSPIRRTGSNECIDVPWIEHRREADLTLDNGWNRHIRAIASLDHDERYVVVTEQVDIADTDPAHPDTPARDVRRIDGERFIHVEGTGFYTRQTPLWSRVIPNAGATTLSAEDLRR